MLGVFGDPSRLGEEPDRRYRSIEWLEGFEERVVPFLWVPRTGIRGSVVDVYGRRRLFAFNNSGCILSPGVRNRVRQALLKAERLGYDSLMLDAVRLPSPIDRLLFISTCFCNHSLSAFPELGYTATLVRRALYKPDADAFLEALEELAHTRIRHVEALLGEASELAEKLGISLSAAVFPYLLSRYVGQDPGILSKYLDEVHVMLYHRCGGAACLNAELEAYAELLTSLGLCAEEIVEIVSRTTGLRLEVEETRSIGGGVRLELVESLADANKSLYGWRFTPVFWLDDEILGRIEVYKVRYKNLDLFIPRQESS
jgi:hypothetical protein